MLVNVEMPISVGILKFIRMKIQHLSRFIFQHFNFKEQLQLLLS